MEHKLCVWICSFVLVLAQSFCLGGVPETINFQGKITAEKALLTGLYSMEFGFYAAETGGMALYHEKQTVLVVDGLYSVLLGASNAVPGRFAAVFTNPVIYLGVVFNGEDLQPRVQMLPTVMALRADTVRDGAITFQNIQNGALGAWHIAAGQVVKSVNETGGAIQIEAGTGLEVVSGGGGITVQRDASVPLLTQQLTTTLRVADGLNVNAGDLMTCSEGTVRTGSWGAEQGWIDLAEWPSETALTALDSNTIVVAVITSDDEGILRIGRLDRATGMFAWGSQASFCANCYMPCLEALTSSQFLIGYIENPSARIGYVRVGLRTNQVECAFPKSAVKATTNNPISMDMCVLSSNRFAVACEEMPGMEDRGMARVGIISSTFGITWGTAAAFNTNLYWSPRVESLDAGTVVVASSGMSEVEVVVGDLQADSFLWGTPVVLPSPGGAKLIQRLSAEKFVMTFDVNDDAYYGGAVIGELYGRSVNWGPVSIFAEFGVPDMGLCALDSEHVAVLYRVTGVKGECLETGSSGALGRQLQIVGCISCWRGWMASTWSQPITTTCRSGVKW